MPHRVFNEGLDRERRHALVAQTRGDIRAREESIPEPNLLDGEIARNEAPLFGERDLITFLLDRGAQQACHHFRCLGRAGGINWNEVHNCVKRIEEKVRMQLRPERR